MAGRDDDDVPSPPDLWQTRIPVNPFRYDTPLTTKEKLKMLVVGVTLFPIRLVLLIVTLLFCIVLSRLSVLGLAADHKGPLPRWRCMIQSPMRYAARVLLFCLGYWRIRVVGAPAAREVAPIVVAAPHSGVADGLLVMWLCNPAVVSMADNVRNPIIGPILRAMQVIPVERGDPASRRACKEAIIERALDPTHWPQTLIFPEGLCTNRKALVTFKPGAFNAGVPVQPVALKFSYSAFNSAWIHNGPGIGMVLIRDMCQVYNSVEVQFLKVYSPTPAETADSRLYAGNVRRELAEVLGLPTTEHAFEDVRLAHEAEVSGRPLEAGLVGFSDIHSAYKLDFDTVRNHFRRFLAIDTDGSGTVDIDEFCAALKLPMSVHVEHLFSVLDDDGDGVVDFRALLIGLMSASAACRRDDVLAFAFSTFDEDADGKVSLDEFADVLSAVWPTLSKEQLAALFDEVDSDGDGAISREEFNAYAAQHPEYVMLFMDVNSAKEEVSEIYSQVFKTHMEDAVAEATRVVESQGLKEE